MKTKNRGERICMDNKRASSREVREPGNWRHHGCAMPSHPILQRVVWVQRRASRPQDLDIGITAAPALAPRWMQRQRLGGCAHWQSQQTPHPSIPQRQPQPFFLCHSPPGNSNERTSTIAEKCIKCGYQGKRNMHDNRKELSPPNFGLFIARST